MFCRLSGWSSPAAPETHQRELERRWPQALCTERKVEHRSRVLHGSWSQLARDECIARQIQFSDTQFAGATNSTTARIASAGVTLLKGDEGTLKKISRQPRAW